MKTNQLFRVLPLLALLLAAWACQPPQEETDLESILQMIEEQNERYEAAWNEQDAQALASYYSTQAITMPPNSEMLRGRNNILEDMRATFESGATTLDLETLEIGGDPNDVWEVGIFTVYGPDEEVLDRGKYIVIWKKEDGEWKIQRDIWNTDMPLPEPEPTDPSM